ncbi:glycosyltransferase [Aestuariivivens sediminicola]|uniref:glycosyltransferase n=1 Tax=Aestuariivivens sediminicola TaxID=2913560 RepID=UPI001F580D55|nr:glycosyltransferase [Aestuariivivens sediminicola]
MDRRIKILFTIPNFDTAGSGKSVYDMVSRLDKNIFNPEVCCFHDRGELFKEIMKLNIKVHLFNTSVSYYPLLTFPFRVFKIYQFFKNGGFNIIHSWHWSSDFSEPLAAKLAGIPFIYTKKAMGWGNKAWLWRSKLSTKIISVNKEIPERFFKNNFSKVTIIPLCVDVKRFSPLEKTYKSPEGLIFGEEDFIIISVANLVPVKGIEILLDAIVRLNDKTIKVLIVGDDKNEYGKELISNYKDFSNIFFLGKKLDVRPYLALADLFVIPTKDEGRKEGLPIAPMEAMSSKRIVLGSDITGIKEVLKNFPDFLFSSGDIDDLISKILKVKEMSFKERELIANRMRAHVENNLSIDRFIREHEALYKQIVGIKN